MAIQTKSVIINEGDVDSHWAFEFYLGLTFPLTGGDHKVRSPFSIDKNPSFSLYKPENDPNGPYRFHCLSSGNKGNIMDLVAKLKGVVMTDKVSRKIVLDIIRKDFSKYLTNNTYVSGIDKQLVNTKGRVTEWELRQWKTSDFAYWSKFGVSSATLEKYNVAPMGSWKMHKIKDGVEKIMTFENPQAYGYLTKSGALAKIYQPGLEDAKFIKVSEYFLQGLDQLMYTKKNLLIISSLKDGMAFNDLDIPDYEWVAPDSENVELRQYDMDMLKTKYKIIRTLFDIDEPGRKAMVKYKDKYGIDSVILEMSKDLSDSVRDFGQMNVKLQLLFQL